MGKRGIVLLHVLMTAVLIAIVSATILHLAMLRFAVTARATRNNQELRYDDAALAVLTTQWSSNNTYCTNDASGIYSCSPASSPPLVSCGCTCTTSTPNYPPTVIGGGSPPSCTLTITSTDLP